MTRYTLHIPLALNDGTPTPKPELHTVENELLRLVGGYTATDGRGAWTDGVTVYNDPVRLYACDTDDDLSIDLGRIAQDACVRLGQECVYLTRQEITADLIYPARRDTANVD